MVLIPVFGLFYESTILCIEDISDPKILREDTREFRRFII